MILHVDMDAFYASVEERDQPRLRGKPIIVGGTPEGRGVVAAANYVVRQFGVRSAMPAAQAKQRCPHAVFLRPRMDHYAAISKQIRDIFYRFTPLVEPLSLDEAFLDVTASEALFGSTIKIGEQIKAAIEQELQLVASVGVAPNKFLAKLASDSDKPNGFVVVDESDVQAFLDPLPVGRLWGVGRATGETFARLGIVTVADLRCRSKQLLRDRLGEQGEHLWNLARGIDNRRVVPDREAKSISHETTFEMDIDDREVLKAWALELSEQVARRLRRHNLKGRTIQLKIRFSDFKTVTRSQTISQPTNVTQEIWQAIEQMLDARLPQTRMAIRLLGVGVAGLDRPAQQQRLLFEDEQQQSQASLDEAADSIREKFGTSAIGRASRLMHQINHKPEPLHNDQDQRNKARRNNDQSEDGSAR